MAMCGNELYSVENANAALGRYFEMLSKTGYVKAGSVRHLLVRLFILDMLKYAADYITAEDYDKFGSLLHNLESGDCLLPYSVYCTNRTAYGVNGEDGNDYAGPLT